MQKLFITCDCSVGGRTLTRGKVYELPAAEYAAVVQANRGRTPRPAEDKAPAKTKKAKGKAAS